MGFVVVVVFFFFFFFFFFFARLIILHYVTVSYMLPLFSLFFCSDILVSVFFYRFIKRTRPALNKFHLRSYFARVGFQLNIKIISYSFGITLLNTCIYDTSSVLKCFGMCMEGERAG